MEERFEKFLIDHNYSEETPSGAPSTVNKYVIYINKVCEWEDCTWAFVAEHIDDFVRDYDTNGCKGTFGSVSHRTVINALKAFKEFLKED